MSFGRWLLVNSFSIFLVTLFVLGYFYREELQLHQAYEQLLNIETDKVLLPETATKSPPQKPVENSPQEPVKIENLSVTVTVEPEPEHIPPSDNLVFADKDTALVAESSTLNYQPESRAEARELNLDEILLHARQSYWDKRYSDSIDLYQQLIGKDPENPDLRGELGNIYYALNDYPNASNLYFQAANLLIAQNQRQRAQALVSPITAMNRELGTRLSESLK